MFAQVRGAGTARDDVLVGSGADEVFTGGQGNDWIIGGGGVDVYQFSLGDGQDVITTNGTPDGRGIIAFGAGIALEDIVASRDGDGNTVLSIRNTTDRITLIGPQDDATPIIAKLRFADGREQSYLSVVQGIANIDGDNHIIMPSGGTTGVSGVNVFGGTGNDTVVTGAGNDIITGGLGNDVLQGGPGNDTYYVARGDGQDTIIDSTRNNSANQDKIHFGPGIAPSDIRFISTNGQDVVLGINGGDERITIAHMLDSSDWGVQKFEFADGTVWSRADILAHTGLGTAGDDRIDLTNSGWQSNTIVGGAGNDTLIGSWTLRHLCVQPGRRPGYDSGE